MRVYYCLYYYSRTHESLLLSPDGGRCLWRPTTHVNVNIVFIIDYSDDCSVPIEYHTQRREEPDTQKPCLAEHGQSASDARSYMHGHLQRSGRSDRVSYACTVINPRRACAARVTVVVPCVCVCVCELFQGPHLQLTQLSDKVGILAVSV